MDADEEVKFSYPPLKNLVRRGKAFGFHWAIATNDISPEWWSGNERGLCGYVFIPSAHPDSLRSYDEVPVDAHGGLTFASSDDNWAGRWFGFDTGHSCCNRSECNDGKPWDEACVEREVRRVAHGFHRRWVDGTLQNAVKESADAMREAVGTYMFDLTEKAEHLPSPFLIEPPGWAWEEQQKVAADGFLETGLIQDPGQVVPCPRIGRFVITLSLSRDELAEMVKKVTR